MDTFFPLIILASDPMTPFHNHFISPLCWLDTICQCWQNSANTDIRIRFEHGIGHSSQECVVWKGVIWGAYGATRWKSEKNEVHSGEHVKFYPLYYIILVHIDWFPSWSVHCGGEWVVNPPGSERQSFGGAAWHSHLALIFDFWAGIKHTAPGVIGLLLLAWTPYSKSQGAATTSIIS